VSISDSAAAELRHRAREQAIQWLYQWEVGGLHLDDVFDDTRQVQLHARDKDRDRLAEEIVRGTAERLEQIDPLIAEAAANWRLERIAVIDRLILRLATYELLVTPNVPHAVVINEALELTRTFSSEEAVKFVNGVLDGIRKKVRE
jgi:N utilization substance protein B